MISNLLKFLSSKDGSDIGIIDKTHVIFQLSSGTESDKIVRQFKLSGENYSEFMLRYCADLPQVASLENLSYIGYRDSEMTEKKEDFTFAESVVEDMPLAVKLTMKFSDSKINGVDDCFDDEFVKAMVQMIYRCIDELVEINDKNAKICVVLNSDTYQSNEEETIQCDILFMFPFLCTGIEFAQQTLLKVLFVMMRKSNVMVAGNSNGSIKSCLHNQNLNDVICWNYGTRYVLLYGSKVSGVSEPCLLRMIVVKINDDATAMETVDVDEVFNIGLHNLESYIVGRRPEEKRGRHKKKDAGSFDTCSIATMNNESLLPLYLSCRFWCDVTYPKPGINKILDTYLSHDSDMQQLVKRGKDLFNAPTIDLFEGVMPKHMGEKSMIAFLRMIPGKAMHIGTFIEVGKAIHHITNGSERGKKYWERYGVINGTPNNMDKKFIGLLWSKLEIGNLITVETLAYFAKHDSSDLYHRWQDMWSHNFFIKSLIGTDGPVSRFFYSIMWLNYKYAEAGSNKGKWYMFKQHRWQTIMVHELKADIESRLNDEYYKKVKLIQDILDKLVAEKKREEDPNEGKKTKEPKEKPTETEDIHGMNIAQLEETIKAINKIRVKIGTTAFKDNIVKSLKECFCYPHFADSCDTNHSLTCMKNCVLESMDLSWTNYVDGEVIQATNIEVSDEVKNISSIDTLDMLSKFDSGTMTYTGEEISTKVFSQESCMTITMKNEVDELKKLHIRAGKPEDFLTMCTNTSYNRALTWESKIVRETLRWLMRIFPDKDLFIFVMLVTTAKLSDVLVRMFFFWKGIGKNSKSMLKYLYDIGWGDYSRDIPYTAFTKQRASSGSATPEWSNTRNAKFIWSVEPDADEFFHGGNTKEAVGGDRKFARALYSDPIPIVCDFVVNILCNVIPSFKNFGVAEKDRTMVIDFVSRWIKDAPASVDEQEEKHLYPEDDSFKNKIKYYAEAFMWIVVQFHEKFLNTEIRAPDAVVKANQDYWRRVDYYIIFNTKMVDHEKTGIAREAYKVWQKHKKAGTPKLWMKDIDKETAAGLAKYEIDFSDPECLSLNDAYVTFRNYFRGIVNKAVYDKFNMISFENEIIHIFGDFTDYEDKTWCNVFLNSSAEQTVEF